MSTGSPSRPELSVRSNGFLVEKRKCQKGKGDTQTVADATRCPMAKFRQFGLSVCDCGTLFIVVPAGLSLSLVWLKKRYLLSTHGVQRSVDPVMTLIPSRLRT